MNQAVDNDHHIQADDMKRIMHVFSHDLRNPLLNIQALMQEMNMAIGDAKEAQAAQNKQALMDIIHEDMPDTLAMLQESAGRMDNMIAGINDIYHCMFDELECEAVDMQQMVQRCFALLKLDAQGIVLQAVNLPSVYADPLAVKRLVSELLMNAAKAMAIQDPALPKWIEIRAGAAGDLLSFRVTDNGGGFLQQEKSRLFEPFFSGQRFTNTSGQGLARVKALVERHGGKVEVAANTNGELVGIIFSLPSLTAA